MEGRKLSKKEVPISKTQKTRISIWKSLTKGQAWRSKMVLQQGTSTIRSWSTRDKDLVSFQKENFKN